MLDAPFLIRVSIVSSDPFSVTPNGYVFVNKALKRFPRHAGLWLCMAHILENIPEYRQQARAAAENAMVCLKEPQQQPPRVTAADVEPILRSLK
jgi:hypothetical protein